MFCEEILQWKPLYNASGC